MFRMNALKFGCVLSLMLGTWAVAARAEDFRYRYSSLDQIQVPQGAAFFDPVAILDDGRICGTMYYDDPAASPQVSVYHEGALTVLAPGFTQTASTNGIVGGGVFLDLNSGTTQAALFRDGKVELIPRQPGEYTSYVFKVTESGLALVISGFADHSTYSLYRRGRVTPLPIKGGFLDINDRGQISGTTFGAFARGFRYDTATGVTTVLNPVPPDPSSWGMAINERGGVLGYSFVENALERIGVFDRRGQFHTYFVEGTPQFPTVSNRLAFNENNLIVVSLTTDRNTYLVPRPGVRLNLADLVVNGPVPPQSFALVLSLNNRGDMIVTSFSSTFLLERIDDEDGEDR